MPSIAFVAPIVPGKTDLLRQAAQSQAPGGERRAAYEASRERHGITREASWIQPTPMGDLTVVYIEADDLEAMFDGLGSSQDPFDVWFREQTARSTASTSRTACHHPTRSSPSRPTRRPRSTQPARTIRRAAPGPSPQHRSALRVDGRGPTVGRPRGQGTKAAGRPQG